jgi:type IV secretory pathway TraG/TraD family ATPase VirD4
MRGNSHRRVNVHPTAESTVGVLLSWIVLACLVVLAFALREWLARFIHFLEDYTTGFLKVREICSQLNREAVWKLSSQHASDEYLGHELEIGVSESSGYTQRLVLPGDYRPTHMYIVGASGSGKSSLLKNLLIQDISAGMGLCVIDPHGDLVYDLVPFLGERASKTILLDLSDDQKMLVYNPLERRKGVMVAEQVAKLILAFKRIWADSWGARMEDILRHTLSLLVEQKYTLAEFERVLVDADFREMLVEETTIDQARDYFLGRYNVWNAKERSMMIESSLNKVSAFLSDPRIGLPMSLPTSAFNIKEIMDGHGILLVNLAKAKLAGNADLFGALLMADIEMSFLSRKANERTPFALYVDEFQNIATESFDTVLAEARKFGLCMTLAHQSLKQLDDKLVSLILGNAQTQIYFRVARQDAERLAKESANIIEQLKEQEDMLTLEPVHKLSLQELWEAAFHSLGRLTVRDAYVMVKGAMEHPELIRTLDTPTTMPVRFPFNDAYRPMSELAKAHAERRAALEKELKERTTKKAHEKKTDTPPPESLGFLGSDK